MKVFNSTKHIFFLNPTLVSLSFFLQFLSDKSDVNIREYLMLAVGS